MPRLEVGYTTRPPAHHSHRSAALAAQDAPIRLGEQVGRDAVIDKVEVKRLGELSPNEVEHDNPMLRTPEEMAGYLSQLYNRDVTLDDTVTLIRFSEIRNS